jgi:hypothetical protein
MREKVRAVVRAVLKGGAAALGSVIGRWDWHAPAWLTVTGTQLRRLGRHLRARPTHAAALAVALVAAGAGFY